MSEDLVNDIKDAAEGDIEAIEKLSSLAAKDYVMGLAIADEDKTAINNLIDELSDKDIEIGAKVSVDNQEGINAINDMLSLQKQISYNIIFFDEILTEESC